jgi:hypothetical protein
MDPIDAALPISVTLTAGEWNQVIALCADGVWRIADPLIKAITRQIFAAAASAALQPAAAAGNGAENAHVSD